MTWLVRVVLFVAGIVAGWFIPRDQIGYDIVQFVVAILFLLVVSLIVLYFPRIKHMFSAIPDRAKSDDLGADDRKS